LTTKIWGDLTCTVTRSIPYLIVVYFVKFLSSKGHNSHKIQEIKISWKNAQLYMMPLLPTKFHEILIFPEIYYDQIWNRMCHCACQISSDLRYQYLQTTRSTSEILLWCAKSSLERLDTWHSTNSHGRCISYINICHIMVAVINWHYTSLLSIQMSSVNMI
jgi:hypothetical protein